MPELNWTQFTENQRAEQSFQKNSVSPYFQWNPPWTLFPTKWINKKREALSPPATDGAQVGGKMTTLLGRNVSCSPAKKKTDLQNKTFLCLGKIVLMQGIILLRLQIYLNTRHLWWFSPSDWHNYRIYCQPKVVPHSYKELGIWEVIFKDLSHIRAGLGLRVTKMLTLVRYLDPSTKGELHLHIILDRHLEIY